ncbi:MAG: helix-turn-helix domain-containing protein [Coriobacteriales bacterium]|nr:helix-turn-helix domain-containing protein [Coriobacteriales bacterium]
MEVKATHQRGTNNDLVKREGERIVSEVARMRRDLGYSQARLAMAAGIKQPVVARMETGVNSPRLDTILKVLLPLGKTLKIVDLH